MEALKTVTGAYKCLFGIVCYADRSANRLILTSLGFVNMQVKTCTCLLFVLRYQSNHKRTQFVCHPRRLHLNDFVFVSHVFAYSLSSIF